MSGISSKALTNSPGNKFKYNGKEEQREEFTDGSGLEWTDYGARMYDNQIGRWSNIDPKSELNRRWSPQVYCANSPFKYIDPDGMKWEDPEQAAELNNKLLTAKKRLQNESDKYKKQIDDNEVGVSEEKLNEIQNLYTLLNEQIELIEEIIQTIKDLGEDKEYTYALVTLDGTSDRKNHVERSKNKKTIYIYGSDDALHVHELKHVSLARLSSKGMRFHPKSQLLLTLDPTGEFDEIAAYKTQYAFSSSSLPGDPSYKNINLKYLATMRDGNGNIVYPSLYKKWNKLSDQEKKKYD